MPRPNTDGGFLLPVELDPPRRCVQLHIPDDVNHIRAFWGALDELQMWFSWQRDNDKTGTLVAQIWRDVLTLAHELFDSDNPCPCEEPMDCCDPILERLDLIIDLLQSAPRADLVPYIEFRQQIDITVNTAGFEPTDMHPSAPDISFTEGTGDVDMLEERQRALCHIEPRCGGLNRSVLVG